MHNQYFPGRRAVEAEADGRHHHGPGLSESVPPGHSRRRGRGPWARSPPAAATERSGSCRIDGQQASRRRCWSGTPRRKANGKLMIRRTDNHTEPSRKRFETIREAIEAYGGDREAAGGLPRP